MQYPPLLTYSYRSEWRREITVFGEGSVSTAPDIANIRMSVQTENQKLAVAQEENARNMNQLIHALKTLGIAGNSIQTTGYTIQPLYDYIEGENIFKGYEVLHGLTIQLDNLSEVGNILDTAVQNGANRISGIEFLLQNPSIIYQQALRLALKDAHQKAETISNTFQLPTHLQPFKINELKDGSSQPFTFSKMETTIPSIEPGQIKIIAMVEVKYYF